MICIDWDPNCPSDCLYDPMWAEDLGEKQEHLHGTELCRRGWGPEGGAYESV